MDLQEKGLSFISESPVSRVESTTRPIKGIVGIEISINHLPSKRSIFNANSGIDDGEFARFGGLGLHCQ